MAYKKPYDEMQNNQLPSWATGATNVPGMTAQAGAAAQQQTPTWSQQVADLYSQITNRQPFSYDVNTDPLFKGYKDQYVQGGRRAMEDTMGQAAGLTGGYGSSYSQAVGQQQYNDYMTKLNAEIPNFYAQARSAYDKEGDDLYNRYQMAAQMENQEYARGRDALEDQRYQDQLDYERGQAAQDRAYNMVMQMLATGQTPSADLLAQAGVSSDYAKAMANYYKSQMAGNGSSNSSSTNPKRTPLKDTPASDDTPAKDESPAYTPTRQITPKQEKELLIQAQRVFAGDEPQWDDFDKWMNQFYANDMYGNYLDVARGIFNELVKPYRR